MFVKPAVVQPALACPPPSTDAETHFMLTAETGTDMQPSKFDEVVPAIKLHISPFLP
jgi:hypothetical protein